MTRLRGALVSCLVFVAALGCGPKDEVASTLAKGSGRAGGPPEDARGVDTGSSVDITRPRPLARAAWHPKELLAVAGREDGRHWGPIRCATFSADGKLIASGGDDRVVRVWDAATLRPVRVLAGHEGAVLGVAFSPDGKRLASAGADQAVRLWGLSSDKSDEPDVLKWHQCPVAAVAFAPDGKALATAGESDGTVVLWDVSGVNPRKGATLKGHAQWPLRADYSTDGKLLRAGEKTWDVTASPPKAAPADQKGPARWAVAAPQGALAWAASPAGDRVAFSARDHLVRLKHVGGVFTADIAFGGHAAAVRALAFSPDGRVLATGGDDRGLRLWDIGADRPTLVTTVKETFAWRHAGLSADGKTLAVAVARGERTAAFDWAVWDVAGREPKRIGTVRFGDRDFYAKPLVALSPDGKRLAVAGAKGLIRLHEVGGQVKEVAQLTIQPGEKRAFGQLDELCYSPDGKRLGVLYSDHEARGRGATIRLEEWDVSEATPRLLHRLQPRVARSVDYRVAYSPDGKRVAVAGDAGTAVYDLGGGKARELARVTGMADFTPDSKKLVGGWPLQVWDLDKQLPPDQAGTGKRGRLTVLPDGKTVVHEEQYGGGKVGVFVYGLGGPEGARLKCAAPEHFAQAVAGTGRRLALHERASFAPPQVYSLDYTESKPRPPGPGHTAPLRAVAMSKSLLATAGADKGFRLWKLGEGALAEHAAVAAHEGPVTALAFSPDGTRLASGGQDRTVLLWDLSAATPKELPTYTGHNSPVTRLAYSADGKELTVTSDAGVVVWDVTGKRPREKRAGGDAKDERAGKPSDQLEGRPEALVAFVSSPDGKVSAAAGADGRVTAWGAAGKKLASWKFPAAVAGLALSADGKRLATANPNGTAYVLRVD